MRDATEVEFRPGALATEDVLYARLGSLGRIRLNRPRAINALTHEMVRSMLAQLQEWAGDDAVEVVSLEGAGERGLCAGGDVRAIRASIMDGAGDAVGFWADEYRLDSAIHRYPKPVVAAMDGIVMGGGVGLSAYAGLRVVTERSRVAMPETAIGFFPDVGALYLLSRAPGELGTHLALTGSTIGGPDAIACGLADVLVDSASLPALLDRLASGEVPAPGELAQGELAGEPAVGDLAAQRAWVDACYAGDDPAAILERLRGRSETAARDAADLMASRSPLSVAVTLEAVRRARRLPALEDVLAQDLALGAAFLHGSDFVEGVRAVLVDRDHTPRWAHSSLAEVDRERVLRMFAEAPQP